MSVVKTYSQVNKADASVSFGISKMQDIYEQRHGKADEPHRHDFYTILLIKKSKGVHTIDFNSHPLSENQIYFISPGQIHQLYEEKKSHGFSIVFSHQFLTLNGIPLSFIEDIKLFHDFGETPPLELEPEPFGKIFSYAQEIRSFYEYQGRYKFQAIGALLKLLLIRCHGLCELTQLDTQTMESGGGLLRKFKKLVEEKFTIWHQSSQYAGALHITPDHLNRTIKSLTGKTAKEHLQNRLVIAAKRMLYFSTLSQKEIAYELGFSEPSNFSAFFKNCTGISPTEFRKSV